MPPVHVSDNLQLAPGGYRVLVLGNEIGAGQCKSGRLLAIHPTVGGSPIEGERTVDPTFGMPATWIAPKVKELAEALGHTVVDHATIIATHLEELLRTHAHKLLGRQEVQHLLDLLARTSPKLVDDVVPNLLSLGDVVRVMRNLVREGISIRDTRTIIESLGELSAQTKDPEQLTELIRERLVGSHYVSTARTRWLRHSADARSSARGDSSPVVARHRDWKRRSAGPRVAANSRRKCRQGDCQSRRWRHPVHRDSS